MWADATLAFSCGVGSGIFVATDVRFHGNYLSPFLGERTGDSILHDCLLAGCSTFAGFLLGQAVLCVVLPAGALWCDFDDEDGSVPEARRFGSDWFSSLISEEHPNYEATTVAGKETHIEQPRRARRTRRGSLQLTLTEEESAALGQ